MSKNLNENKITLEKTELEYKLLLDENIRNIKK